MALLAALLLGAPVLGAGAGPQADVFVHPNGVQIVPNFGFARAVLTISGPGQIYRQVFGRGETPIVNVVDDSGQPFPDGTYTWELSYIHDPEVAKQLRIEASARKNGLEVFGAAVPGSQNGTFAIVNGFAVDPSVQEPLPMREAGPPASLEGSSGIELAGGSAPGASAPRGPAGDSDDEVAAGAVEVFTTPAAQVQQAAGGLAQADRASSGDNDETALALGHSPEHRPVSDSNNTPDNR